MILENGMAATTFGTVQGVFAVVLGFGLSQNVVDSNPEILVVVWNVVDACVVGALVVGGVAGGGDRPARIHGFWRSKYLLHTANASLFSRL